MAYAGSCAESAEAKGVSPAVSVAAQVHLMLSVPRPSTHNQQTHNHNTATRSTQHQHPHSTSSSHMCAHVYMALRWCYSSSPDTSLPGEIAVPHPHSAPTTKASRAHHTTRSGRADQQQGACHMHGPARMATSCSAAPPTCGCRHTRKLKPPRSTAVHAATLVLSTQNNHKNLQLRRQPR